jgi:radical SAM superfamily enzyme YgiQ (UPF0313 family)
MTGSEHEVTLCDENVEEIDFDVDADIVGVTGYIIHKPRMIEILSEFRRRGRFLVVGGPFASLCPEELREHVDVVFSDEAEATWPQFLHDYQAGVWKSEYRPSEKPDMSLAAMPRFDLVKVDRYHAMTVQFARGCPFNCEFCDIIVVYGRRPRTKRVDQVMAEIARCHELGATQVFIVDDNFIGNVELAKELLRKLADWGQSRGYPIDFNTEVSLNVANDPELLELMRAANFTTIFIGIESPRPDSLRETRKNQNLRGDMIESIRRVQAHGIQIQAGMIVGFDADDPSIFREQLDFVQKARIPVSMTGMLQALPKTPLRARVEQEGRLLSESTGDQFMFSNILPVAMSRLELYEGYAWLLSELYDFDNYRERTLAFLLHRGGQVHGGRNIRKGDLRRLARVLDAMLLRGGPRRAWFTLRLLGETLLRRPSVFKEAVSFALVHMAFHDYMRRLSVDIEASIHEIRSPEATPGSARTPQDAPARST